MKEYPSDEIFIRLLNMHRVLLPSHLRRDIRMLQTYHWELKQDVKMKNEKIEQLGRELSKLKRSK